MIIQDELEYRKKKRVEKIICLYDDNCFSLCPTCEAPINIEYSKFCSHCGQKLSWYGFSRLKIIYR